MTIPFILVPAIGAWWVLHWCVYVPYVDQAAKRPNGLFESKAGCSDWTGVWSTRGIRFGWDCYHYQIQWSGKSSSSVTVVVTWRPTLAWAERAASRKVRLDRRRWGL